MKPRTSFEIYRWLYFFVLWLVAMSLIVMLGEFVIGPAIQWLFNNIPYSLPTWRRLGRLVLFVLFMGFFAGTVCWFYEKKSSGR
jgi:hypothetical protein